MEEGLVHVDIALPDFRIAFFMAPPPTAGASGRAGGGHLASLDAEGTMLSGCAGGGVRGLGVQWCGAERAARHCIGHAASLPALPAVLYCRYVANETPGTQLAKLHLLQQRGWVVLPLAWVDKCAGRAGGAGCAAAAWRAGAQPAMPARCHTPEQVAECVPAPPCPNRVQHPGRG